MVAFHRTQLSADPENVIQLTREGGTLNNTVKYVRDFEDNLTME